MKVFVFVMNYDLSLKCWPKADNLRASSPRSIASQMDRIDVCYKAEQVLGAFVSILSVGSNFSRFSAVLPVPRICLLLLGEAPTPTIARHILCVIGVAMKISPSFARKFELASGWTALRLILPSIWNDEIQRSVFDVLFGYTGKGQDDRGNQTVACPNIMPVVLAALDRGLALVVQAHPDEETTGT